MKYLLGIVGLLILSGAVGCASPWQSSFQPNPVLRGQKFSPSESVQVHSVEFERLQRYAAAEHKLRVESTTAPEDLPASEKSAAKDRLLEALQLKERGDQIEVLGWSEFSDDERLSPNDPKLEQFAKSIGADYVVVSSEYAGKAARTVERPMTTYSNSYVTVAGPRGRRGAVVSQSDTSTTWVPMNVIEDRFLYSAAFLRKSR